MKRKSDRRWFLTSLAALGSTGLLSTASRPAAAEPSTVGELATASSGQFSDDWRTLSFEGTYDSPVIVMGPLSANGGQSAHPRLRNVSSDGAAWKPEEWSYQDGRHIEEAASYLVMEAGASSPNGTPIRAGTVETDEDWASVKFGTPFDRTPVVLTQCQTYNGYDAVVTRVRDVSQSGFETRVQEAEQKGNHITEEIGYIAIGPGGESGFESGTVRTDERWESLSVSSSYDRPAFVASTQSFDGGDTAGLRRRNIDSSSVDVRVEEERSDDAETNHVDETVGYVFGEQGPIENGGDGTGADESASETTFGAFLYNKNGTPTEEYESWLGRDDVVNQTFINSTDVMRTLPSWAVDKWVDWLAGEPDNKLSWSVHHQGGDLSVGANGGYNDDWRSFGERLVEEGMNDAIVRVETEHDLDFVPMQPTNETEYRQFAAYFRQTADALRSVPGQDFEIVWNPNTDIIEQEDAARTTWPGREYVDTVGTNVYDRSWQHYDADSEPTLEDHKKAWSYLESQLDWFTSFADEKDKPFALVEWGVWSRDGWDHAGGDNPYFIQQVYGWIQANEPKRHVYFEDLDKHRLHGPETKMPEASAKFKQLFG